MISYFVSLCIFVTATPLPPDSETSIIPIYEHRPNYGIVGFNDAKIQMSAKVKIIQTTEVYVGYTQLMLWNVYKKSVPMRDINFNPEIFYRWKFGFEETQWLDFGVYEHESNGQDDVDSRAWDRSYLRYHGRFDLGEHLHFFWNAKAWWPWRIDEASPDLKKYRGLWELDLTLKDFLPALFVTDELNVRVFPGGSKWVNPLAGGQEVSLRGKIYAKNFLPYLVIQFFHGKGENLFDYKRNTLEVRAGIGY